MNRYILLIVLPVLLLLASCKKDFMTVDSVKAYVTPEQLYANYNYVQAAVWNVYSYLPDGFADLNYEAATSNAEATNSLDFSQKFNDGIWDQFNNPDNSWNRDFNGIRQANLYLVNKDKVNIDFIRDRITTSDSTSLFNARNNIKFMEGEVLFLKAFFYFDLVKRYGGVPIMDEPLDFDDDNTWKNLPRNSVDECIKYIVGLCDKAVQIIPENLAPYSWYESGRVTNGAIRALKAKTLLFGASPLFKEAGSTTKWEDAAQAYNDLFLLNAYSLDGNYSNLFGPNNAGSKELIFFRRYGNTNSVEYNNFPILFQNSNGNSLSPTQNFVDEFEVLDKDVNGNVTGSHPFDWNNSQDISHIYQDRDPRFYATVVYNGAVFSSRVIETFSGGNSGQPKLNATKTGYYLAKWVNPLIDLQAGTQSSHLWMYFRYGEMLLDYSEAMLNAYGADNDPEGYGLTALGAINMIRGRAGVPPLDASNLNQNAIEHERNVEMGFEGKRLWDVRRWQKGTSLLNESIERIDINQQGSGFNYSKKVLEPRIFSKKMRWYPIPQVEIDKTQWAQNPDW